MVVNEDPFNIHLFFQGLPHQSQEIIYLGQGRYKEGYVQQKRQLVREVRSFLPGIKTVYVQSIESPRHRSYARFLWAQPGREAALRLAELTEGSRKQVFYPSEGLSVTVGLTHREDGKALTTLSCEVEHADCRSFDFIFKHPVGIRYRELLTSLWTRFKRTLVIYPDCPLAECSHLAYLTKPRHPDPKQVPALLQTYTHYLKKLDGVGGSLYFHSHGQRIVLADGRSLELASQAHLTYDWTDALILRVETLPNSQTLITDLLQGTYGEVMSQLPYMYRHFYLAHLTDISPLTQNLPRAPTCPLTDTSDSDGILLLDAYTLTPPYKLKSTYTIDVLYLGNDTFASLDGTEYRAADDALLPLVDGVIYECQPLDPLHPLHPRPDKHVPDSDATILHCRTLTTHYTLPQVWTADTIGMKCKVLIDLKRNHS